MIYFKSLTRYIVAQIIRTRGSCIKCTIYPTCVDFREGGKPEYPEKNPRSTGKINYEELNSHETQTRPGLACSVVRGTTNATVARATLSLPKALLVSRLKVFSQTTRQSPYLPHLNNTSEYSLYTVTRLEIPHFKYKARSRCYVFHTGCRTNIF